MAIYLGLGSNLGDRRGQLRDALQMLADGIEVGQVSPVVESPALLPADAPAEWNAPFLNLVAECRSDLPPDALLMRLKAIEQSLGRDTGPRWAPRPIDIDILLYDDLCVDTAALTIPHAGLEQRAFFLTPLAALRPGLVLPRSRSGRPVTVLEALRRLGTPIPLWMGIVNLTPDSFSDGGRLGDWTAVETHIDEMLSSGVHLLDFGAESTRPGARPLSPDEEWRRLEPILARCIDKLSPDPLRPAISIDTYHPDVAARALSLGADTINDVGGLTDPAMIALAAETRADFIAMHNLGLPADPAVRLATDESATDQVERWLDEQLRAWEAAGIDIDRLTFDPGIGFGKTSLQSIGLLRDIRRFATKGIRLLVGHSRKSFMSGFAARTLHDRDLVTIGSSLALCGSVDILRVHNVADHVCAWRGWSHLQTP